MAKMIHYPFKPIGLEEARKKFDALMKLNPVNMATYNRNFSNVFDFAGNPPSRMIIVKGEDENRNQIISVSTTTPMTSKDTALLISNGITKVLKNNFGLSNPDHIEYDGQMILHLYISK